MDFNEMVNKESFKAIILNHLKIQAKHKLGQSVIEKIKENSSENSSPDDIINTVSETLLNSNEYSVFLSSFLGNLESLLEDKNTYVVKEDKRDNISQCSSASSINSSSMDFLSPDQFQNTVHNLKTGTNAEKLEALEMLHRLPTLEHLTNRMSWNDIEQGLRDSLSSKIIFLKTAALKLYTKMLTSSESKVVQDSYLSLSNYILQSLLPALSLHGTDLYVSDSLKCSFELVAIFNKFLQNISGHWLRYPQSVIENISAQNLCVFSYACENEGTFLFWTSFALCDPEAKWLKNIIYGHISREAFLSTLMNDPSILTFCIDFCKKFNSEECSFNQMNCCENVTLTTVVTHLICIIAHILQYCEGRDIFDSIFSDWTEVLKEVMCCTYKLSMHACYKCCQTPCNVLSEKWKYFWSHDITDEVYNNLLNIFLSVFSDFQALNFNSLYFLSECLYHSFESIVSFSSECKSGIKNALFQLLNTVKDICVESSELSLPMLQVLNSVASLVKRILGIPTILFLTTEFVEIFYNWIAFIHENHATKLLSNKSSIISEYGDNIFTNVEQNYLNLSVFLMKKPHFLSVIQDNTALEANLNILLEKIFKTIKSNTVCLLDISVLSSALNSNITLKQVLNKTILFRLSSIIWELHEINNCKDFQVIKRILEMIIPTVICSLEPFEVCTEAYGNYDSEVLLMQRVILSTKVINDVLLCEDYQILFLEVLSLLSSSLHSICCLEAKFKVSELLLEQQSLHYTIDENPIIDQISILRNYILVKFLTIGGSGERNLPEEEFHSSEEYRWPFISSCESSESFYKSISRADIDVTLNEELSHLDLQNAFLDCLKVYGAASSEFCFQVLSKCPLVFSTEFETPEHLNFSAVNCTELTLSEEEQVGLSLIKRYDSILNQSVDEDSDKLEDFLKMGKYLIGSNAKNLDIFVCTIYLMCKYNLDVGWSFLQSLSKMPRAFYIWFEHLKKASELSQKYIQLHSKILEFCDLTVKTVLPQVFSVLQLSGVLPSALYSYWTVHCYWNFLDFSEISNFVMLSVLFTGLFSVYFFISILKHLQKYILLNAHNCDLITILKKKPIDNYKLCDHIDFLIELSDKFGKMESVYISELFLKRG